MRPSEHQLKLFDLSKYREIQPIIESIANATVDCQQVVPLVQAAIKAVEHDDFEKYNDPDERECFFDDLQEMLDVLQIGELLPWLAANENNSDILKQVIYLICCPDYQYLPTYNEKPGTSIDYGDIDYGDKICELEFVKVLEDLEDVEGEITAEKIRIPSWSTRVYVFNQKQLADLEKSVCLDILTLAQLNKPLNERHSMFREVYLKIYFNINQLMDRIRSNSNYTLVNEDSFL